MADKWVCTGTEEVADCRVFAVRKNRCVNENTGNAADFFVIDSPDWVNIIPIAPDGRIVLIEQFRHGTESLTLEIPGGMIDSGEEPEECARRELTEETGFVAESLIMLGRSNPNPALQSNWIYHFAATGCKKSAGQTLDEHESIDVRLVESTDIDNLIADAKITHSLVIAGFQLLKIYRDTNSNFAYES